MVASFERGYRQGGRNSIDLTERSSIERNVGLSWEFSSAIPSPSLRRGLCGKPNTTNSLFSGERTLLLEYHLVHSTSMRNERKYLYGGVSWKDPSGPSSCDTTGTSELKEMMYSGLPPFDVRMADSSAVKVPKIRTMKK